MQSLVNTSGAGCSVSNLIFSPILLHHVVYSPHYVVDYFLVTWSNYQLLFVILNDLINLEGNESYLGNLQGLRSIVKEC